MITLLTWTGIDDHAALAQRPTSTSASVNSAVPSSVPQVAADANSPEWASVLDQRGRQRIQYAYDLASRGAVHSAQQELLKVLRTVAQAMDTERQTREYSQSLFLAEAAFEEAEDFVRVSESRGRNLDVSSLISGHRTPILKQADPQSLTPVIAIQQYYSFASNQLTSAAGGQPVAAEALYALGRVTSLYRHHPSASDMDSASLLEQKMLVFYKSAWSVDPKHYQAANELGVLLARFGQWSQARVAFEHSVAYMQEAQNWQNLAVTYEQLGEEQLAEQAWNRFRGLNESKAIPASGTSTSARIAPAVEWVDLETFSQSGTPTGADPLASSDSPDEQTQKSRSESDEQLQDTQPGGLLHKQPFQRLKSVFKRSEATP